MDFHRWIGGLFLFCALLAAGGGCATSRPGLDGAWEMVITSPETPDPQPVKILADGHFALGAQSPDGKITWRGGGYSDYDGDRYTETVTDHWIPTLIGATIEFDCVLEDGTWHHEARFERLGEIFNIDEVWRRIETSD